MRFWNNMKHRKKQDGLQSFNPCIEITQSILKSRKVPIPNAPVPYINVDIALLHNYYQDNNYVITSINDINSKLTMNEFIEETKKNEDKIKEIDVEIESNQSTLVDHLMEVGWIPNYKYVEQEKKDNRKINGILYNLDDVDMEALVSGKYMNDFHLISKCESYTVKITRESATFWQKDPDWICLTEQEIKRIKFYDKGVKLGPMKIELEWDDINEEINQEA